MKRILILAALLAAGAASAQQTLSYTDGNPEFNASISLASGLPENGTTDVTPTAFNFVPVQAYTEFGGLVYTPGFEPTVAPLYQFTTVNGQITAFDVSLVMNTGPSSTPTELTYTLSSTAGDSFYELTYGAGCEVGTQDVCFPQSASSAPGTWVETPPTVPELYASSAWTGLMLLIGGMAVMRGRRA